MKKVIQRHIHPKYQKVSKSINIRNILKFLKSKGSQKLIISTLGGRAEIVFKRETKPRVICINSKQNQRDISKIFSKVLARYKGLKRKGERTGNGRLKYLTTKSYSIDTWKTSPDKIFAPYIAAIIAKLDKLYS
jgi:hypothetical protein